MILEPSKWAAFFNRGSGQCGMIKEIVKVGEREVN